MDEVSRRPHPATIAVVLALGLSSSLGAQSTVPTCRGTTETGERDTILLGANGQPRIIPRSFFTENPTTALYYGFRSNPRGNPPLIVEPIWIPPAKVPTIISLPAQSGFIDADRDTTALYERLKSLLVRVAPVRYVDSALGSIIDVRVDALSAASVERGAYLLGRVTFQVQTLKANCAVGYAVHVDYRSYRNDIQQLCPGAQECAVAIADNIAHWIEQNFGLAYEKAR